MNQSFEEWYVYHRGLARCVLIRRNGLCMIRGKELPCVHRTSVRALASNECNEWHVMNEHGMNND